MPLAVLPVCCVTFHLKSEQALATGRGCDEVQLPRSAATPLADGSERARALVAEAADEAAEAARQSAMKRVSHSSTWMSAKSSDGAPRDGRVTRTAAGAASGKIAGAIAGGGEKYTTRFQARPCAEVRNPQLLYFSFELVTRF